MKKVIQTPAGFQVVDSFIEPQYFGAEELPSTEQVTLRAAYMQAIVDLQTIINTSDTPVIDTLPKAQVAIRQLIIASQQIAAISIKILQYLKTQRIAGIDI